MNLTENDTLMDILNDYNIIITCSSHFLSLINYSKEGRKQASKQGTPIDAQRSNICIQWIFSY